MGHLLQVAKAAAEQDATSNWNRVKTKIHYSGRKAVRNAPRYMTKAVVGALAGIPGISDAATAATDKAIDGGKALRAKNNASKNGQYQTLEAQQQAAESTDKVLGRKEAKQAIKDAIVSLESLSMQQVKLRDRLQKLKPIEKDIKELQCSQLPDDVMEKAGSSNAAEKFLTEVYLVPAIELLAIQRYQIKMRQLRNNVAESLAYVDAYLDNTEEAVAEAIDQTENAFEAHLKSVTDAVKLAAQTSVATSQAAGGPGSANVRPGVVPGQVPGSPQPASHGVRRPGISPLPPNPRSRFPDKR